MNRRGASTILALAAIASLGACSNSKTAEQSAPVTTTMVAGAVAPPKAVAPTPAPAAEPAAQVAASAAAAPAAVSTPAVPPEKPKLPPGIEAPKKLVGLDRAALQELLGAPWMKRQEGTAELWQYRASNCVLDVFLFAKPNAVPRVTHTDLRGRRDNRPAPAGCYADIVMGGERKQTAAF